MGTLLRNYDPEKVSVIFNGRQIRMFGDEIFKLARTGDNVSLKVGVQGDGTYVENADKSATLTVTIQQQSPDLRYLESCAERRTQASLAVNDANDDGRNIFALNCRVQKLPDRGRGKDAADVPFAFIIPRLELND